MPQDRLTSLADGGSSSTEITAASLHGGMAAAQRSIRGIGLGIESVATFPEVENYPEDEFYRTNFTAAEITFCGGQASPRSSFCELAAAKRAVRKAGAAPGSTESFAAIEITRDEAGNPSYPDCLLSIDRLETAVVAICLWTKEHSGSPLAAPTGPSSPRRTLASLSPLQRLGFRLLMGFVALSLLFIFGAGSWFILNQILH